MCTALAFRAREHFFGRNLDLEYTYDESVVIAPRAFPLRFRMAEPLLRHHAIIGIAHVQEEYPLYYDAANEAGLAVAGLQFPLSTVYHAPAPDRINIAPFELIPWLLGQCASVAEARTLLQKARLIALDYSERLPCTPLHWLIADRTESIVLESRADGLRIYDDPVDVLTNEPPFPLMLALSEQDDRPVPGDYSSISRFQKAVYARRNLRAPTVDVHGFFHLLASVAVPCRGLSPSHPERITQYTACCDLDRGIYYYTTYADQAIHAVALSRADRGGSALCTYPLRKRPMIDRQN